MAVIVAISKKVKNIEGKNAEVICDKKQRASVFLVSMTIADTYQQKMLGFDKYGT